jgi:hypothetical protein
MMLRMGLYRLDNDQSSACTEHLLACQLGEDTVTFYCLFDFYVLFSLILCVLAVTLLGPMQLVYN